jgi:hypothetical protein
MEIDRTVIAGVGGLLAGAVLTYAVGASNRAELAAQIERQAAQIAGFETIAERVEALDTKLDSVAASVAESADPASIEAALAERIEGLGARLEGLGGSLSGIGSEVGSTLSRELGALGERLSALTARPMPGTPPDEAAPAPETGSASDLPAPDPAAATGVGERIGIGQTAVLADGALRVFLSRVDAEGQSARVAVNGQATETLVLGNGLTAGDCRVTLTGIEGREAIVDAVCGAEAAAAPAAETAGAAGAGSGIGIGETAVFADGALRVFLSAILPDGSGARVAINGQETVTIAAGENVAAGDCTLTLAGIDGRQASFAADCGGSADTAAAPEGAATGSGEGTEVGIGETGIFADGALRVFLSAFDPEAGTARVAINGPVVTALAMGSPAQAGDCTVTLTGGEGRRAIIDGRC